MYRADCDLCENDNYKVLGDIKNNTLVKCMICGHIYMLNRFERDELKAIYDADYFKEKYVKGNEKVEYDYLKDKPNILKFVEKRFETIHKYKSPGKILDIGCALGFYLEYAKEYGWDVNGIEISEYACEYAKNLLNSENVFCGNVEDMVFDSEMFDVITMWLVLEHFVNPIKILKRVRKWMKKDGILGIKIPNADGITFRTDLEKWIEQHPEDHMCDFTPDTMQRIMLKCGFELLEYETEGIYLERFTSEKKWIEDKGINEIYSRISKECNIGDSLVMYFKRL